MFDPTVFENLMVGIENVVYDLDNLEEKVRIVNRINRMELSVLSREFALRFIRPGHEQIVAEIGLLASVKDLADEILERPLTSPACSLRISFDLPLTDPEVQCPQIGQLLLELWGPDVPVTQTLTEVYGAAAEPVLCRAELNFARRVNEEQMGDISGLADYMLLTLERLEDVIR
jgi:hypothetical protein